MTKTTAEKIAKVLPDTLKNATGYLKSNFDKSGQETLTNATGTVSILVKLFAQDAIDDYFEKLTKEKLKDFGSATYLKASLIQVGKSLEALNEEEIQIENAESLVALLIDTLEVDEETFTEDKILTLFTPQYHPIVIFVKEQMEKILSQLNIHSVTIKSFTKNFNENIESTIIETFGSEDYEKHKEEVEEFIFEKNECKFLWDTYELHKIGFSESESLKYMDTFAFWKPLSRIHSKKEDHEMEKNFPDSFSIKDLRTARQKLEDGYIFNQEIENDLVKVEELIEEYFSQNNDSFIESILFIVADFGRGKSTFLRHYASNLAKAYLAKKEGYIPVYFNLREYEQFKTNHSLGVLNNYLRKRYKIAIDSEESKKKKYFFLVDSLDESGELTKPKMDDVISSIKSIQNLDDIKCRNNKIIITSRPFSDGLIDIIKANKPYIQNENDKRTIFLYGFKKEQFNLWLDDTLKDNKSYRILKKSYPNIYEKLLESKTLSKTELRRPIFAYMIYWLIEHSIDIFNIGKIGIYLSFVNLLTKEAKYIGDKSHNINHMEEIRYRNILHSISALWMYERQQGKQGILKKADICRVLDGENRRESDREILERYKKDKVTELQFLSHSYFGEEDNNLHFQHQSFAEILLAEYYLKVFIKYALDKKSDIDTARSKLVLGEPTEQTVEFFKELIRLLKETTTKEVTPEVIEKRKLLYPLLASLAMEKHNTLFSDDIYSLWFRNFDIHSSSQVKDVFVEKWAIGEKEIEKIMDLAIKIIDSKTTLMMAKTKSRTALFNEELTIIQNAKVSDFPPDMDKWLALVIGNLLHDDVPEERRLFNGKLGNPEHLFEMICNWIQ